ncbi:MAG TPA: sulfurtransferase complex subunit TusB, partial [Rhodocyclaceae bacterium]|nr:sulfurtransferase complex subunit TusB [Rhodocyclaceae bacterium]
MLHIINKSPLEKSTLDTCLSVASAGSIVLLIEDAVYAATRGNAFEAKLQAAQGRFKICVLTPDLEARGMADRLMAGVTG